MFQFSGRLVHTGIVVLLMLIFTSCHKGTVYHQNEDINDAAWDMKDIKQFTFENTDSLQPYNFYIIVRNSTLYSYSNLFLFMNTTFPDGMMFSDTVECVLATSEGKWTGKGIGSIKENIFTIRKNTRLPQKGIYQFEIQQGMRHEILEGIHDIGFKIVKSSEKK